MNKSAYAAVVMKKTILSAITFLCMASGGFAGGFNLDSVSIADLKDSDNVSIAVIPAPAEPVASIPKDLKTALALDLDMSVKIPFSELNKRMVGLAAIMKVLDQSKPVLFRQGDHIVFTNVTVDYKGMDIEPTILIKPSFEGENRLAIRFTKADADVALGPKGMESLSKSGLIAGMSVPPFSRIQQVNKDDLIAAIADGLTASMIESMDGSFAANKVRLRAKDVLSFTYDKASWTLRAAIKPDFVAPLLPGLVSNVSLTAFSFDDTGFTLGVKAGSGAAIDRLPGYNLALSDGLLTNFLRKCAEGGDYDLAPQDYDGGVRFRADGRVEVAFKNSMRNSTYVKLDVYATIEFTPILTAPNTIAIRFEKVTVDKAYGFGIPGKLNDILQSKVIAMMVNNVMANKDLAQTMAIRKVDGNTVELKLKNSAFLPSFGKGVVINKMKIERGLMYLGFEF
ncbi:MAG: hypothetical protein NTX59_00470 [Elusimicrobia bacterium]|nr:hypothetical protein [Elusimicrobiota bacterium]